jgi:hypothetical protein
MSQRQARIGWGLVLGACGGICLSLSIGLAQQTKTPAVETLLPAGSVFYLGFDGYDAHRQAWENTAAHDALYKTGLIDAVKKIIVRAGAQADSNEFDLFKQAFEHISDKGLSLAIALPAPGAGPPLPWATVVVHQGANMEAGLADLIEQAAEGTMEFKETQVQGRKVTSGMVPRSPGVEIGWWTEGSHLVIAVGINAVESTIAVASGGSANITTNPLWKKYRDGKTDFEVASVGWLDFGSLRQSFGEVPIPSPSNPQLTVNQVLETLGLDTLGALACQSGFKGKAMWSATEIQAPAPRKGLLALADQKPISMADLPPLPFGTNGFYACSIDWSKLYDQVTKLAMDVSAFGPEDEAAMVEGMIAALPDILGFDLKKGLLDPLGNVICVYGDTRQGMFGMGMGLVLKVDDAKTLRNTADDILEIVAEQFGAQELAIRRNQKQGREIVTLEIGGGFVNPSFAVDDGWLVVGLFPQTVEAFLLRVDGKLTNWKPSTTYEEGFAELPKQFTSIAATDPRKSYRAILGIVPVILPAIQAGLRQTRMLFGHGIELSISVADFPPAEQVARPLFPNLSVCTVDAEGIHWTSRTSLPSIPLLGAGGGSGVATVGVLTALLLPAVGQSRTAARRAQSRNNMKQIGLALHIYHDAEGSFPQGTHPNENLKPEKRLSWLTDLLPYMDEQAAFDRIDFEKGWDDEANREVLAQRMDLYLNPGVTEKKESKLGTTHYVGIAGVGKDAPTLPVNHKKAGIFGYNRVARIRDVRDGTSNTLMVSGAGKDFGGWGVGGKATIRALTKKPYINGPDGIGGAFPGGCHFMFADGSVQFISENTDPEVLEGLATMNGREVVPRGF